MEHKNQKETNYQKETNLTMKITQDTRDTFAIMFKLYKFSENYGTIYKNDPKTEIPKKLITLYYKKINPNYNDMIYSFKRKYIDNEILVEKNDTKEQRQGLTKVYEYIQNYEENIEEFNIFMIAMKINMLLWGPRDEKFTEDLTKERDEVEQLEKEAKAEKNLAKYKLKREKLKDINERRSNIKIGGQLRQGSSEVNLQSVDFLVPSGEEACRFMNSFLNPEKREEFKKQYNNEDIIQYIEYCVKTTTDLIKYQPFNDGNKRTFRSLLNLMFKERNLPPVYVKTKERNEYKRALLKAIQEGDYSLMVGFYLFKICDSIYELDIEPYLKKNPVKYAIEYEENPRPFPTIDKEQEDITHDTYMVTITNDGEEIKTVIEEKKPKKK